MTNPSLAALDAQIFNAFNATGWADDAVLTINSVDHPCTVFLDRDAQTVGEDGQVIGPLVTADFRLAEVLPVQGATLAIGSESWVLEKEISADESISAWILNPGTS